MTKNKVFNLLCFILCFTLILSGCTIKIESNNSVKNNDTVDVITNEIASYEDSGDMFDTKDERVEDSQGNVKSDPNDKLQGENTKENSVEKPPGITIENQNTKIKLPILMYHDINEKLQDNGTVVTPKTFEKQIKSILDAGYESVSLKEVIDFVHNGKKLPKKPILITFDDGYRSNYNIAFPILQKYNVKAVISVVGSGMFELTTSEKAPHFTTTEAKEMINSGLISIEYHTYRLHEYSSSGREGMTILENEKPLDYIKVIKDDFKLFNNKVNNVLNNKIQVCTYPFGKHNDFLEDYLKENNIPASFLVKEGVNTIAKGNKDSLYKLNRIAVFESTDILKKIQRYI